MKKFLSVLSFFLTVFMCSCTNSSMTLNHGIAEDNNVTAPGELPIVNNSITLTCAIEASETVADYETNDFTLWIEEKTGINLEFEVMKDLKKDLAEKIACGEEIPEVIFGSGFSMIDRVKNGINGTGVLLELGDYMDNYSYWLNDIYTKSNISDVEKQLYSADGNRYFVPHIVEQIGNNYGMKTWINKTWLDKLGLEIPKTTEEFREVMKAFVTMDPNGNGLCDELGITGNADGWCAQPYRFLINSFIAEGNPDTAMYANVDDEGKLYINFTKKEYKDALEYISDLSKEGLFDKKCFTRYGDEMLALAQNEDNVIGCFTTGSPDRVFSTNRERMLEYEALPPLEGPGGVAYAYYVPTKAGAGAYITKYCKHPLAAFRLLDFMMSKEASLRGRYGVEGRDWVYAEDGDICIFESIGQKAVVKSSFQYGSFQNAIWENRNPEFRFSDIANGMAWNGDPYDGEKFKADGLEKYINKQPEKSVTQIEHTEDEYEEFMILYNRIIPYAEEQIRLFIIGEKDVKEHWNNFQSELKTLGIEKYLELLQTGYDRYENSIWHK